MTAVEDLPLAGMSVVDFTNGLAGPLTAQILGDLGASVVKVESVGRGDLTREMLSPTMFMATNRNKRSLSIDLKDPRGLEVVKRLLVGADVLVESFRPGIMESLGLGPTEVMRDNPGLVYASMSGFGPDGPNSQRRAVDAVAQAESGMMVANGDREAPFTPVDIGGGVALAQGVLAALVRRGRTGRGELVQSTLVSTSVQLQSVAVAEFAYSGAVLTPEERKRRQPTAGTFKTADGPVYIAAHYEEHWRALCEVLGAPDLPDDPRYKTRDDRVANGAELRGDLEKLFSANTRAHWFEGLTARGVMCGVVKDYAEVFSDDTSPVNRTLIRDADAEPPMTFAGLPYTFGGGAFAMRMPPPALGEHSAAVLGELGYSAEQVDALVQDGVVAAGQPND